MHRDAVIHVAKRCSENAWTWGTTVAADVGRKFYSHTYIQCVTV